ncbi:hypothetical protein [Parablautia muri]|jgi:hypothetical protein|uniref:Uncharacterized protein n=1 Tax=Parablautia muri TaxID=2320879 RepID=A0A9X5BK62_9FIRM|nr:hypothetical protein [Parablautia muri]MCX4328802.1 hypothetical protein [Lachnospiraceae bacterium]NBJ95226.1 hypothetical protein [Parablautia muri]
MGNEIYTSIKEKLKAKPKKLTDLDQWLFVVVNTAKSIIDNTSKNNLDNVVKLYDCNSTSQIQHEFDIIQGKFGREGFSQRYSPVYIYLCSLVANFPNQELSNKDKELIMQYSTVETYLLYEI